MGKSVNAFLAKAGSLIVELKERADVSPFIVSELNALFPKVKEAMAKIKDSVQSYLSGKKLEYTEAVDASLIGGFTVKVDSKLLDASISNELRKLRLKLLSNK